MSLRPGSNLLRVVATKAPPATLTRLGHDFCEDAIDQDGIGGGIVVIARCPDDGSVRVLLGRERFSNWKGGCRWSGFEGSRKADETLKSTSCREFDEETMSCVMDNEEVRERIAGKRYWARIVTKVTKDNVPRASVPDDGDSEAGNDGDGGFSGCKRLSTTPTYFTTYVLVRKYDPNLVDRFKTVRASVEHIEMLVQEWSMASNFLPTELCSSRVEIGEMRVIDSSGEIFTVSLDVAYVADEEASPSRQTRFYEGGEAISVQYWVEVRDKVKRAYEACDHMAVKVSFGKIITHEPVDVRVNTDYLEKDQLRWWTEEELAKVMRSGGMHEVERFRPYFLPVLDILLDELERRRRASELRKT